MLLSRTIEDKLHGVIRQARLTGRIISGRGQEAIPAGATLAPERREETPFVQGAVRPLHHPVNLESELRCLGRAAVRFLARLVGLSWG
jgi:TPP-dependent pyruvate/acetoin dehydrogenase alpha subunit